MTDEEFENFIKSTFNKNEKTSNCKSVTLSSDISHLNDNQRKEFLTQFQDIKKDKIFSFNYSSNFANLKCYSKLSEADIAIITCIENVNGYMGFDYNIDPLTHESFKIPDHVVDKLGICSVYKEDLNDEKIRRIYFEAFHIADYDYTEDFCEIFAKNRYLGDIHIESAGNGNYKSNSSLIELYRKNKSITNFEC